MKLFTLILLAAVLLPYAASAQNAVIREATGTVEIKRPGAAEWTAARTGDAVEKAAVISTGFRSTAILAVGSSTLIVRPLTRLSLEELMNQNETETINVNLSTGRIRVEVTPPAGSRADFSIRSPSATASVRGTSFEMDPVSLRVTEGGVSYAPAAETSARAVNVSAGQESRVDEDTGAVLHPMAVAEADRALPELPGQSAVFADRGARLETPRGSIEFTITLSGYKEE